MIALDEFTLEPQSGPRDKSPLNSRVYRNGEQTDLVLPGCVLLHQFRVADGYLFVTNHDCPLEEMTELTLCDDGLKVLASQSIGAAYVSVDLDQAKPIGENQVLLFSGETDARVVTVQSASVPVLGSRLKVARATKSQVADFVTNSK